MTTRDTPFAAGTPCWVDLATSDLAASTAFYSALFGWDVEPGQEEFGGYATATSDGKNVAGIFPKTPDMQFPDAWTTYIATDDSEATCASIAESGGTVMQTPMPVADLGVMSIGIDPSGGVFGLWQAGTHTGFQRYNEPGCVTWDEHNSKDFEATTPFYEGLFGWGIKKTTDTDEFRYYEAQIDGETVAGLMDAKAHLPADAPSSWAVYFSVEDADEAAAKATELGGRVIQEPVDTPYGRLAELADPTGASFKLHSMKMANPEAAGSDDNG